jgi:CDGSH-type Zn-finger protein
MENKKAHFKVFAGGPLKVSGAFQISLPGGSILPTEEPVYLCRCGHSSDKPFCDGSHKHNSFSE